MAQEISNLGYIGESKAFRKLEAFGKNVQKNGSAVAANAVAEEYGDRYSHRTVITLKPGFTFTPAGAADLAMGKEIYKFPAGKIRVLSTAVDLKLQGNGTVNADTPVVGLGSVVGSGAVAVLSGTSTFINMMTGFAVTDCNGTPARSASASSFASVAGPSVYLNIADGWAGADTITVSGRIVLRWELLDEN